MSDIKSIAFIGLGAMGLPMAKRLAQAGFQVRSAVHKNKAAGTSWPQRAGRYSPPSRGRRGGRPDPLHPAQRRGHGERVPGSRLLRGGAPGRPHPGHDFLHRGDDEESRGTVVGEKGGRRGRAGVRRCRRRPVRRTDHLRRRCRRGGPLWRQCSRSWARTCSAWRR
jgi:hypothetical protein